MAKNQVSVVIPTLNEQDNINPLIGRLTDVFTAADIEYEIIFVDDHSTDATIEHIAAFSAPVYVHVKEGLRGKATSLMEGFASARYDTIVMIDADLQYPPEAIPAMIASLTPGETDIVVADRKTPETSLLRRIASKTFRLVFGKFLWNLDVDVQSGLKVFRKVILDHVDLRPEGWTFDLDFLVQARDAGYTIGGHDIVFAERATGNAKLHVISATFQIGLSALGLRLKHGRHANNYQVAPAQSWFRILKPHALALSLASLAAVVTMAFALPAAADTIVDPAKAIVASTAAFVADTSSLAVKAAGFGQTTTPSPTPAQTPTPTPTLTQSQAPTQTLPLTSATTQALSSTLTPNSSTCTTPTYTRSLSPSKSQNDYALGGYYVGSSSVSLQSTGALAVCNYDNWYITASVPTTASDTNVKTRAFVGQDMKAQTVASFKTISSTFAETAPAAGSYDFAYDIQLTDAVSKSTTHVAVWTDAVGRIPTGTDIGTFTSGGETYTVWKNNTDITFVASTNITSGTLDLLSFINYAAGQSWVPAISTIQSIDYGPDIVATDGTGAQFQVTSFSITTN